MHTVHPMVRTQAIVLKLYKPLGVDKKEDNPTRDLMDGAC